MNRRGFRAVSWLIALSVGAGAAFGSFAASAYSDLLLFPEPANFGGGAGRFFSGSIQDGMSCEVCHLAGGADPGAVTFEGLPLDGYQPGKSYTISVLFPKGSENAAAVAEFVNASGRQTGALSQPPQAAARADELEPAEIFEALTSRTVFGVSALGVSGFTAIWQAPASGDFVHFHLAAVVGDGSGDPAGDSVQVFHHELYASGTAPAAVVQRGALPTPPLNSSSFVNATPPSFRAEEAVAFGHDGFSCSVDGGTSASWTAFAATLGGLGLMLRTLVRRRARAVLAIALAATSGMGCATVKPHERGRLAQADMALDGNGDLLAGQRHGTEYREGSSGGFGGGGGGCGCN